MIVILFEPCSRYPLVQTPSEIIELFRTLHRNDVTKLSPSQQMICDWLSFSSKLYNFSRISSLEKLPFELILFILMYLFFMLEFISLFFSYCHYEISFKLYGIDIKHSTMSSDKASDMYHPSLFLE